MESLRIRVETWIREQTVKLPPLFTPPPAPRWTWPPWRPGGDRREKERLLREEYERHRRQLDDLCSAVKADSIADLQEILCSMILSECVYKRPATEMIRVINKFKSDFGGQIISLERVQYSLDHVPHRYLLAEAGDTLFASFIGTKQYKDVIADVNIFQGDIFHEENSEEFDAVEVFENDQVEDNHVKPLQANPKRLKRSSKPAAHRGFLARAKGIPALELYRLAKRKNRKLVLCGHSLGGAVAALATLAILRVLASSPLSKEHEEVQVKCITFSQPPVGNSALKDYVHRKGWQHSFKSYCIPEDLVPRILSPAYFHHYSSQTQKESLDTKLSVTSSMKNEETAKISSTRKSKEADKAQLVLGLGPVQTSFWRLSKLVPLDSIRKNLNPFKRPGSRFGEASLIAGPGLQLTTDGREAEPQSLEIKEGADGISLTLRPDTDVGSAEPNSSLIDGKNSKEVQGSRRWQRVPYLPSYVPFGQLYLLGSSSVESLSDAEYSKLTSVKSVITELRELFQSHSMKSYRSRFQKIYDHCMGINASSFLGIEQLSQFPNLQQWLGLPVAGAVELGHIVEPPVIRTATSILPLGWSGTAGTKNREPLKVDIVGHGLHLCTVFQARLNGIWCSTAVESSPSMPSYSSNHHVEPILQKMRILIGAPLKRQPKLSITEESLLPNLPSPDTECANACTEYNESFCDEGLNGFVIYCTSDFITVSKEVYFRTRRVRLVGLEGAGKSSLFKAILDQGTQRNKVSFECVYPEVDGQEAMEGGLCYLDSPGVNLQELDLEAKRFKEELQKGIHDLRKKIDLVVLVHNLSQKIPQHCHQSNSSKPQPALSLLLNEATALGVPWVLAIPNKFSVSAHQQMALVNSAIDAYQATPSVTRVVNSCPFVIPSTAGDESPSSPDYNSNTNKAAVFAGDESHSSQDYNSNTNTSGRTWNFLPRIQMPFRKRATVLPAEGVSGVRQLVHIVLRAHEEAGFEELANERLSIELAREEERAVDMKRERQDKGGALTAAAVGASLGAGLGLVMAVVMGAASALRKP